MSFSSFFRSVFFNDMSLNADDMTLAQVLCDQQLLRGEKMTWVDEAFIYGSIKNRIGIFTPEFELAYVKEAVDSL
ncbi:MAG: hypothetical protein SCM11_03230 [Bacillota bacterium]|nr:hypothetical protein [Bacillota bacterium]